MKKKLIEHAGIIFYVMIISLLVPTLILVVILFNDITRLNRVIQILGSLDSIEVNTN